MVKAEPTGPYVYQPFGSASDPEHEAAGRLWGVGGVSEYTEIKGLTKEEAEAVVDGVAWGSADSYERVKRNVELGTLIDDGKGQGTLGGKESK